MSYKHNNLMAMREQYWQDQSAHVLTEKAALQQLLSTLEVMPQPSLEDAKYVFFHLPSAIILQGYALGFSHPKVTSLISAFIETHKPQLRVQQGLKIRFRG
ncbi:hypothetical protein [Acinetobacter sp.]|uniref:hypothetical protein n=1 Tax=Acinetobacter sp. TaxID=472 RepID=UPI00388E0A10